MLVHNQLQYGSRFIKQCELFMHLSSAIPWGGGTPGKGGDFVKDPVKVLIFPLLGGDTEESKFPSTGKIIKFPCMYYLWFFGGFAVVFNKIPCVEKALFFHTWFLHKSTDGF